MLHMGVTLIDPQQSIRLIYDFTGGHPNVVQRLCSRLTSRIQFRIPRELPPFDVQEVINDPTFQRHDFLDTYFQRMSILEQIIMLVLSQTKQPMPRSIIREKLVEFGINAKLEIIEYSLQNLEVVRQMLQNTQNGYRCVIKGFPTVLGHSILAREKLEELIDIYSRPEEEQ